MQGRARGQGAKVCVVDTGCDPFATVRRSVTSDRVVDFFQSGGRAKDRSESQHGTNVASIIKSSAPGVELAIAKCGEDRGQISAEAFIKAVRWAREWGANVVNISLGFHTRESCHAGTCPMCKLVNQLTDRGIVVVVASGNYNAAVPRSDELMCPAVAPGALSVGAVDEEGYTADYTVRQTFGHAKPNMLAPGTVRLASGEILSGTSFAAPVVSAAVAALGVEIGYQVAVDVITNTAKPSVPRSSAGTVWRTELSEGLGGG